MLKLSEHISIDRISYFVKLIFVEKYTQTGNCMSLKYPMIDLVSIDTRLFNK